MIDEAQAILGYRFNDEALLREALTHASIADHRVNSNERMEFLGDSILGFLVSEHLFVNFPDDLEGDLTKLKSAVVSRKVCAAISQRLDLCSLMSLGKGMTNRPKLPQSVAAAVLESIIAAIYLDGGIDQVRDFLIRQVQPFIDEAAQTAHQYNFKSVLQQHAQRHMNSNPVYMLLDEKGPDHSKAFQVCVEIDGCRYESAWANSKKEAEQQSALLALQRLGVISEHETDQNGQAQATEQSEQSER